MEAWDSSESFDASESIRESMRVSLPKDSNRVSKTSSSGGVIATVPRYVIDLDKDPKERWNQVVDNYKGTE